MPGWYATLSHPKMHAHTKFGIPTSNNMRYAPDTNILKTRSEVKVTVTPKWYETLYHPKMHPHIKLGFLSSNTRDMLRTHLFWKLGQVIVKVTVTRKWYATLRHPKMHPHTKFGIPTSKNIYRRYAPDTIILKTRSMVKVKVKRKWF